MSGLWHEKSVDPYLDVRSGPRRDYQWHKNVRGKACCYVCQGRSNHDAWNNRRYLFKRQFAKMLMKAKLTDGHVENIFTESELPPLGVERVGRLRPGRICRNIL